MGVRGEAMPLVCCERLPIDSVLDVLYPPLERLTWLLRG